MADRKISDLTALTTPASGDFLPIVDISEAAAASKNKRITIEELMRGMPDGTAAAPSIAFESDPNTGIYSPGADQVAISTGGTGRLFVDADGDVGVGTSTPTHPLALRRGAGVSSYAEFVGNGAPANFLLVGQDTAGLSRIFQNGANPITLWTNGAERMRLTSAGLLGLGTSSPRGLLDLGPGTGDGPLSSTPSEYQLILNADQSTTGDISRNIAFVNTTFDVSAAINSYDAGSGVSNGLVFATANAGTLTEKLRITHTGLVGIGNTSPATTLDVNGDVTITDKIIHGGNTNTAIRFPAADTVSVETAGSERARIDTSGRLLVGTSTAFNSGSTIEAAGSSGGVVTLTNTNTDITGANSVFGQINFYTADTSGGNTGIFAKITAESNGNFDGNGSRGMDLKFFTGNVTIGANTPTERLRITSAGVLQVAEAGNIAVGTTTGTKIGTATTQKLGFYNATPVVQPTAVADATTAVDVITQLNALLAKLRTLGIIAT